MRHPPPPTHTHTLEISPLTIMSRDSNEEPLPSFSQGKPVLYEIYLLKNFATVLATVLKKLKK